MTSAAVLSMFFEYGLLIKIIWFVLSVSFINEELYRNVQLTQKIKSQKSDENVINNL